MIGVVIGEKVAWTVDEDCPCSFVYNGGYYVWDKDYLKAKNYYIEKENLLQWRKILYIATHIRKNTRTKSTITPPPKNA